MLCKCTDIQLDFWYVLTKNIGILSRLCWFLEALQKYCVTEKWFSSKDFDLSTTLKLKVKIKSFLGYVIEKCEDGMDLWQKVPGHVTKTSHVVKDLEPGKKYRFRVKAENKMGLGEPVETYSAILAKNPFGK